MRTTIVEPIGVELTELAVSDVDVGTVSALLADHGVVVIAGQDVDDAAFVGFLKSFGELTFTEGETPVPGFPDLNAVSNVGRTTPPRSVFHVDTSYVRHPPAYTALRAVRIPERGGQTLFTNQYRAYDALRGELVAALDGRTITHRASGTEAEHPVFRRHPLSGRTSLYLSTPERCVAISGMASRGSSKRASTAPSPARASSPRWPQLPESRSTSSSEPLSTRPRRRGEQPVTPFRWPAATWRPAGRAGQP
jgi:taurine dioxygenase